MTSNTYFPSVGKLLLRKIYSLARFQLRIKVSRDTFIREGNAKVEGFAV
jgi:hypothetical protein